MAYFPSSIIPKLLSPCTESTSREMNILEFPGGIAYDHEAFPKIVAVHTLVEVSPEQINAQDVTMTSTDVKKKDSVKIPVAHESGTRNGNRRWIILSKPEQPFSQITTAPKTPEERFQTQALPNPSCHDTFPRKRLFNLCDINHGSYCEDVDGKSHKTTKSGGVCRDIFSIPKFSSYCADIGCTETEPVGSRQPHETEKRKETITSKISNQLVNSVKLRISPSLKTGSGPATQNLATPYLAAEGISSGAASGQSIEAVNAKVSIEQEIAVSPRNSLASSKDSVAHCAGAKEELPGTKILGLPVKALKKTESMVTSCSDPKHASKRSKKILGKSNDAAKVGKVSQKQRAKLSNKKLSTSNPDIEDCGEKTSNAKLINKLGKTPLTQTLKSQKQSTKCNSAMEQTSSTTKRSNSKMGKLSLKERIQNRLNRLEHLKSHKQPSEVIDICEKVSKLTKLGFAVASSLNELSKSGEISHQAQEVKGGRQAKKMMLSEGVVEEMVLMEKLRKESKAFAEFTDKQKDVHLKLSEVIKSKNKKKESKEMKNGIETNLENDELAFDSRTSHLSKSLETSVLKRADSRVSKSEETLDKEGNWKGDDKTEAEIELHLKETRNDNFQSKTTGKSLNQCLDKLKFITSSMKRTLEGDKENGLQLTNPDPGSFPKRPRKSAPRRLTMGRWLEDDMDSASPDTAFIDYTNGINFTSSDSEDHLSPSSYPASGKKGNKMEETNGPLYDADSSPTEENNLSSAEENLNLKNANSISVGNPDPCETEKLHALSFTETVSEQAVKERATDSDETLPPARLFTEDTMRQQTEDAAWESCWLSPETKTTPSNHPWVEVHHTSIPRENFTIRTSLDREERIKALLAKQSQLLSKINSSVKET